MFPYQDEDGKVNEINRFLEGQWVVDADSGGSLESLSILRGGYIDFRFSSNKYPTSVMKKYDITKTELQLKIVSLTVYTKDFFSDKKLQQAAFNIYIIDDYVIKLDNGKESTTLKRCHSQILYR